MEPSSLYVQLEHIADLPTNRVNSQRNPSLYEVWRQEITEDNEKQTVRRMRWDGKVPEICFGTKASAAPRSTPAAGYGGGELQDQLPPLPEQGGQPCTRRDLGAESQVTGGSRDEVGDTQRQYTPAGTVDAGTREIGVPATPGGGRSGLGRTLTWIVSGMVEKVVLCGALVKKEGQLLCKELSGAP